MMFGLLTRGLGVSPALLITAGLLSGDAVPESDVSVRPAGGWNFPPEFGRSAEERRKERERLGIIPREQKKLDRAARSIAQRVEPESTPEQIAAEVMRAKEFDKLMSDISARNQQIMEGLALLMAQALQSRILQELQEEDDAIAMLLLEM